MKLKIEIENEPLLLQYLVRLGLGNRAKPKYHAPWVKAVERRSNQS